jgi:hypothetical protein
LPIFGGGITHLRQPAQTGVEHGHEPRERGVEIERDAEALVRLERGEAVERRTHDPRGVDRLLAVEAVAAQDRDDDVDGGARRRERVAPGAARRRSAERRGQLARAARREAPAQVGQAADVACTATARARRDRPPAARA